MTFIKVWFIIGCALQIMYVLAAGIAKNSWKDMYEWLKDQPLPIRSLFALICLFGITVNVSLWPLAIPGYIYIFKNWDDIVY